MSGSEFCKKAMHEAGVAIVPGTAFGKTCNDYVRFSFAASRDNISKAIENIKKNVRLIVVYFFSIIFYNIKNND